MRKLRTTQRTCRPGQRLPCGLTIALLLAAIGCSAAASPATRPADADGPERRPGAIALHAAMVPPETDQSVRIKLHERRETTGDGLPPFNHELQLDLTGRLIRGEPADNGEVPARLRFEHIRLTIGMPDKPETTLRYDSATDKPGAGNPLADLMHHVARAELTIRVGPAGRLRELNGLDHLWNQANLLMAPPALLTAQWLFRDVGMSELVGEALFPPMPAGPVRVGDAWETDVPANIPLVARLNSDLRGTLMEIRERRRGPPAATIEATGTITPAPPVIEDAPPAIRPVVRQASHAVRQVVAPRNHTLTQISDRSIELTVTLEPPAGETQLRMDIRQTRKLVATRIPATRPAN